MRRALIGSRKLSEGNRKKQIVKYFDQCFTYAVKGDTMTSGLCPTGPDAIAQLAYAKAIDQGLASVSQLEVYVSGQRLIDKSVLPYKEHSIIIPSHLQKERDAILTQVMSLNHFNSCDEYSLGMHRRNVHQILGRDLKTPVDEVYTWCIVDAHGEPIGGTRTAIKVAQLFGIPVYNDYDPNDAKEKLSSFTF